jgi:hypothetical protein
MRAAGRTSRIAGYTDGRHRTRGARPTAMWCRLAKDTFMCECNGLWITHRFERRLAAISGRDVSDRATRQICSSSCNQVINRMRRECRSVPTQLSQRHPSQHSCECETRGATERKCDAQCDGVTLQEWDPRVGAWTFGPSRWAFSHRTSSRRTAHRRVRSVVSRWRTHACTPRNATCSCDGGHVAPPVGIHPIRAQKGACM